MKKIRKYDAFSVYSSFSKISSFDLLVEDR